MIILYQVMDNGQILATWYHSKIMNAPLFIFLN